MKSYDALPFRDPALDTHAPVTDANAAGQIWLRGEPKVRLYSTILSTFRALEAAQAEGKQARVTFVHDRGTGNKLFADKAWYVKDTSGLSAFLLKDAAQAWAKSHGGNVIGYDDARAVR